MGEGIILAIYICDDTISPEVTVLDHILSVHQRELHLDTTASFTTSVACLLSRNSRLLHLVDTSPVQVNTFALCKPLKHTSTANTTPKRIISSMSANLGHVISELGSVFRAIQVPRCVVKPMHGLNNPELLSNLPSD